MSVHPYHEDPEESTRHTQKQSTAVFVVRDGRNVTGAATRMSGLSLDDLIQTQQGTRGGDEQISDRPVNNTPSFIHTPSQCCDNGARKYNLIKVKDLACPRRNNPPITNTHTHTRTLAGPVYQSTPLFVVVVVLVVIPRMWTQRTVSLSTPATLQRQHNTLSVWRRSLVKTAVNEAGEDEGTLQRTDRKGLDMS